MIVLMTWFAVIVVAVRLAAIPSPHLALLVLFVALATKRYICNHNSQPYVRRNVTLSRRLTFDSNDKIYGINHPIIHFAKLSTQAREQRFLTLTINSFVLGVIHPILTSFGSVFAVATTAQNLFLAAQ
jgi:hypothetical protein